ncbi:MAG: hypothetical protein C0501_30900 [Isosphaera sp.]|nr:hypothetical protein [Isosphaera sp.]
MRWRMVLTAVVAAGLGLGLVGRLRPAGAAAVPEPVPAGDQEVAWLHIPTAFETWDNFVRGVKRAEMAGDGPAGLEVDESGAYPEKTTAVPEVVVRRKGFAGALRVRWYKQTDDAPAEAWARALAARDPPPLAVLGGWSSDRAKTLADALRETAWPGPRPLLFHANATADKVDPDDDTAAAGGQGPPLISVYDRSFRFCFTNRQMAEAVTDFVLSDPTLRPGPVVWPGLRVAPAAVAGGWAALTTAGADAAAGPVVWPGLRVAPAAAAGGWAAAAAVGVAPAAAAGGWAAAAAARVAQAAPGPPPPGHAIEWKDDPYSTDLSYKFREELRRRAGLVLTTQCVPFSTGRMNRPNPAEAGAAEHVLANLPPPGHRTLLVIPTVTAPARRTLRTIVQGDPGVGRQLVAVTGDGMSVNTFFRDREFAWPVRSIPVPLVLFTHAHPFDWDRPASGAPPTGYELVAPPPGGVRSSTEEVGLFTRLARVVAAAAFPDGVAAVADTPDAVAARLRALDPPFFDANGDRRSGTGEHVVVLRPGFPGDVPAGAALEVYARHPKEPGWRRVAVTPLGRPAEDAGP